jgi:hypothetical protein
MGILYEYTLLSIKSPALMGKSPRRNAQGAVLSFQCVEYLSRAKWVNGIPGKYQLTAICLAKWWHAST